MTIENLINAINECDGGYLTFNLGTVRAFLYKKKWYPLRATINRALELANELSDLTTDRALVKLVHLGLWSRIKDVNFEFQLPVAANLNELNQEIRSLSEILYNTTQL
jgi:hypothetical protein